MIAEEANQQTENKNQDKEFIVTIEETMKCARSKEHFIALMEAEG